MNTLLLKHPPVSVDENAISRIIIGAAIEVHKVLGGPGLLESVYEQALFFELRRRGMQAERQVPVTLHYKGEVLDEPLRLDLVVGGKVIVECKSVKEYNTVYSAQTRTYLHMSGLKLGLVINFGAETVVEGGIHRIVNGL